MISLVALLSCFSFTQLSLGQESSLSESEYKEKLETLQSTIQELKDELKSVKDNRSGLLNNLEENETKVGELMKKIEDIKAQLGTQEQALNDLNLQKKSLIGEQISEKKHIAQQVRAAYRLGGQSNIKLLLNQDDPEKVSRMLRYYDYFLDARTTRLSDYEDNIHTLNTIEPSIVQKTEALKKNQKTLQARYQELQNTQKQRKETLAKLNATVDSKDKELQKLAQDKLVVEKVLTKIANTLYNSQKKSSSNVSGQTVSSSLTSTSNNSEFKKLRGKLPWPTNGTLAHKYGSDRIAGKLKWDGVVIHANTGTPVKAIHHGRVVFADYLRGQGLLIIVDHGNGYMSLYGHNQTLAKKAGNFVEAGEIIGQVGTSGGQARSGLYFEIRENGKPSNPSRWCG